VKVATCGTCARVVYLSDDDMAVCPVCSGPLAVASENGVSAVNSPIEGAGRRILIVDDDDEIRDVLRLLFETHGFVVAGEAADGIEALLIALKSAPDVVVIDEMMPRMNGQRTAAALRPLLPQAKLVAFSAVLSQAPEWADAFLSKERINELAPLIGRLLTAGRRREEV